MTKKYKIGIVSVVVLAFVFFSVYKIVITSGKRNLETEKTEFTISTTEIINELMTDASATTKYLNKAIEIKGVVTQIDNKQLFLDRIIICSMKHSVSSENKGHIVTVKGRFIGYDDLMGELKLDECSIIK